MHRMDAASKWSSLQQGPLGSLAYKKDYACSSMPNEWQHLKLQAPVAWRFANLWFSKSFTVEEEIRKLTQ